MALGLKIWIGVATGVCVLVAAAYLPDSEGGQPDYGQGRVVGVDSFYIDSEANPDYWALAVEHSEVRRSAGHARRYLRLLQQRDSLNRVTEEWAPVGADGLLLVGTDGSPRWVLKVVRSLLDSIKNLPADVSDMPAVVVVDAQVVDSAVAWSDSARWWRRSWFWSYRLGHLVPQGKDVACITTVAFPVGEVDYSDDLARFLMRSFNSHNASLLGPCAYHMAFGPPGTHIGSWLENAGHSFSASPAWLGEQQNLDRAQHYRGWYANFWEPYRYAVYWQAVRCASGDVEACREGALSGRRPSTVPNWWYLSIADRPRGLILRDNYSWGWSYLALGPRQTGYLSDLLIDQGPDRFRRFWTSDAELEVAFEEAFDVPIERWTMEWLRSQIGTPRRGPSAPAGSVMLSLVLGVVFVGAGAAYASRREVT